MRDWKKVLVLPETPIFEVIRIIDGSAMQIALIIDQDTRLIGSVTDGDIRRGILKGIPLHCPVQQVMNRNPVTARLNDGRENILIIMKMKELHQIPVLDEEGCVVGIEFLTELLQPCELENIVVLMAGGLGSRLRPLTNECPKPLLQIGSKPILETILGNCVEYGFRHFYISVNYKAEMVKDYFKDGSQWGVDIRYIHENNPMGTAGPLGLLPGEIVAPLLVMNGDLLTKVNLQQLLDFHRGHQAQATMCVREYDFQVPYGVVKIDRHRLVGIEEKPVHSFFVNAGIYVLNPTVLQFIPQNEYFDMPTLFEKIISENFEVAVFPIREYWLDIGKIGDYERANGEYREVFE